MGAIFIKTKKENEKFRCKCLPNQKNKEGEAIDPEYNVSMDKDLRTAHPVGTIFAIDDVTSVTASLYHAIPKLARVVASPEGERLETCSDSDWADYKTWKAGGSKVSNPRILPTKTFFDKLKEDPKLACPTIEEHGFYIPESLWWLSLRNITKKKNTLFVGPTGTGKTELLQYLATALDMPLHIHDMSNMTDASAALLGIQRFVRGESKFDYAKFTQDIQQPGIILKDELSRALPSANNILLSTLDRRRYLDVPTADSEHARRIHLHEDCAMTATANIGMEYVGTFALDPALMSRYFVIQLSYMPLDMEARVLVNRTKCTEHDARTVASVAMTIRTMATAEDISSGVSHRETLEIAELVKDGMELPEAFRTVLLPMYAEAADRDKINAVIQKY